MKTILYIPLDERFTTRDAFIHLAKLTPYKVITPSRELLPSMKNPADIDKLHSWISKHIKKSDFLVLSAEMFLYGGLINSRLSFDKTELLLKRLDKIREYKKKNPSLKIYLSTVIMRIPAYNLDAEEPDFWQWHGKDIFDYSYYNHRYKVLQNEKDIVKACKIKKDIPDKYLDEFLWRRKRNHQLTKKILDYQKTLNLFENIYITLDDNADYGFNKEEEYILRDIVKNNKLQDKVNIYPGADEVGLTILAKLATTTKGIMPKFQLVYRNPESRNYIPNYEGQSLDQTIKEQITGAGGFISQDKDIILIINNFEQEKQQEAREQSRNDDDQYQVFEDSLSQSKQLAFADLRYSNGGDLDFAEWIHKQQIELGAFSYAAWNTSGNTLGTVIANSIILFLFNKKQENQHFNTIRFLEDVSYQSSIRTDLMNYIYKTSDSIFDLSNDLNFYTKFVSKQMEHEYKKLKKSYKLPYKLKKVYFPWKRTFEIGLELKE
ncbi:DUF4127 family protein [Natronospora cellulosivora (SeqCode)]